MLQAWSKPQQLSFLGQVAKYGWGLIFPTNSRDGNKKVSLIDTFWVAVKSSKCPFKTFPVSFIKSTLKNANNTLRVVYLPLLLTMAHSYSIQKSQKDLQISTVLSNLQS